MGLSLIELQDQTLSGLVAVAKLNNEEQADQSQVWAAMG
jgi:hypothetical protein